MSRTLLALFAVSAASPADDALRAANDAARGGNFAQADTLYGRCEERTTDPGLVAFNRATACFEAGDFREAELNFLRCLEDRDIPADRRLSALYNRGVCLLHRGEDVKLLRVAIGCFEPCVDADRALAKDARHNLELAKLLWAKAVAKQKERPTPNETAEPDPPSAKPLEAPVEDGGPDPGPPTQPNRVPGGSQTQPPAPGTGPMPMPTPQQTAGAGTQPVVRGDAAEVQNLSPADTQALLDRTDARLRDSRRKNEQMRAGPERPNVRDW